METMQAMQCNFLLERQGIDAASWSGHVPTWQVPAAATVWAQPLQLRRHTRALGFDTSPANRWHWRPDYEGIELGRCRHAS